MDITTPLILTFPNGDQRAIPAGSRLDPPHSFDDPSAHVESEILVPDDKVSAVIAARANRLRAVGQWDTAHLELLKALNVIDPDAAFLTAGDIQRTKADPATARQVSVRDAENDLARRWRLGGQETRATRIVQAWISELRE